MPRIIEFLHPHEDRFLTIRECARLQTFPDDFVFLGTVSEQAQILGNAVPPLLAYAIARSLMEDLQDANPVAGEGALLSFVPTLPDGYSPALKRVNGLINEVFEPYLRQKELPLWR